jgi:hypothetical protein
MLKAITHFDQVPLGVVIEIMEREIHKKAWARASEGMTGIRAANWPADEKGEMMKVYSPVDIFRVDKQGPLWLESSGSVDEATARIQQLGAKTSGLYMLLNHTTGNRLTINVEGAGAAAGR